MEKEKEKIIIELLKQEKPYSEIEQQLHISSRDISQTKKKYEEEQNKIQMQSEVQSEVVLSDSYEALREDKQALNNIIFSQREENQELKDELKRACIKRRSGIIAIQTESLYDEVRFLLNRGIEYCYLIFEDNKFKRLVDVLQYEEDLTNAHPIQETNNKLQVNNDGSIF